MRKILIGVLAIMAARNVSADCLAPWGIPVPDRGVVTAYLFPQAPPGSTCLSETRVCVDDTLAGSYQHISCIEDQGCQTSFGYIPHGGTVTAYLNPIEQNGNRCQSEIRVCSMGVLSGFYSFVSCTEVP